MTNVEEQLKKAAKEILLTTEEKDAMRSRLLAFIDSSKKPIPSPYHSKIFVYFKAQYVSLALVVLLVGSGISAAAEQSLPGETLYQVKTSVNENLRSLLTFTPQSKAQLHTELAIRRLQEVEVLAVQGKLDSAAKADVEKNLNTHIAVIKDSVQQLESSNQTELAADTASAAETSLKAHSAILGELAEKNEEVKDVAKKVTTEANAVAVDRATLDSLVSSSTMPADLLKAKQQDAQIAIEEVTKFLHSFATSTATSTPIATSTIAAKISEAEDAVEKGKSKLETKANAAAYIFFQKAERVALEAKALAQGKLDPTEALPDMELTATSTAASTTPLNTVEDTLGTSTASSTLQIIATSTLKVSSTTQIVATTSAKTSSTTPKTATSTKTQ